MFFGSGFPFEDFAGGGPQRQKKKDVDTTSFYKALDVQKECSISDIKKAYRKLAIKHHPDKGGDPETFKRISRAYEVLSDSDKRKTYDEYGEEGLDGTGPSSDPTDLFDIFFGGGRRQRTGKRKGEDIVSAIKVTLDQIYNGATRKMAINKDSICEECDGHGGPEDAIENCSSCGGSGYKVQIRQMGPMIQQTQSVCQLCKGQGKTMPPHRKCKKCTGVGTVKERKILEVNIDKGVPNNHKISFSGDADEKPGEIPGDVVFVVDQQEHAVFKRRGNDLILNRKITLYEALTGFQFLVEHLDGRKLLIESKSGEIVRPDTVRAVMGEGMPTYRNPFSKGAMVIVFKVEFPDKLSPEGRELLRKIIPVPRPLNVNEDDPDIEIHTAVEVDPESLRGGTQGGHSKEVYEEDDEEEGGHGQNQRVQCRQQ